MDDAYYFSNFDVAVGSEADTTIENDPFRFKAFKKNHFHTFVRMASDLELLSNMPVELSENLCVHCLSSGNVDLFSFLKYILRYQVIEELNLSTFSLSQKDVKNIIALLEDMKIRVLWFFCSTLYSGKRSDDVAPLHDYLRQTRRGGVYFLQNHSKTLSGYGAKFHFVVESSSNFNINPQVENSTLTISKELCGFYFNYFNNIKKVIDGNE